MNYTDICEPAEAIFSNLPLEGFGLTDQAVNLTSLVTPSISYLITAAGGAALSSFVISSSIYGLDRTLFYVKRRIIDPLEHKLSMKKNYCKLGNFINRAKDAVIDSLVYNSYNNLRKSMNSFFIEKEKLEKKMEEVQMEDHLENADLQNATFDEMISIFRAIKEQIKQYHNDAIKSGRGCLNLLKSYLKETSKYNSNQVYIEKKDLAEKGVAYIQEWLDHIEKTLGPVFDPKIESTRDELINHLNSWNPASLEPRVSIDSLEIDRKLLTTRPKIILAKLLNVGLPFSQLSFKITNEPAVDGGGVTRDVYTKLFSSLLQESKTSNRSILKLGPYLYVYKGLGVALRQIARNETLFLKDYFNRELFSLIDGVTVDELTIIHENIDLSAIELIKQRVILGLHPSEAFGLNQIFRYKNKTEKSAEDIEEIREFFEESFDYTGDDIDGEINKWLEQKHYYTNADRLIAIATYFKGIAQTANDPSLIDSVKKEELELRASGVNSLDRIQTPLNRQNLADAIILGSVNPLSFEEVSCLEEKCRLIKSWITKESTSEKMLFDFTVFCTGSALLGAGQNIIISYGDAPFFAHTCFNRLDISTRFERGDDQTLEQVYEAFIRDLEYVIEPNTGAAFNSD